MVVSEAALLWPIKSAGLSGEGPGEPSFRS